MINPIVRLRGDYCTNCDTDRAIECYDKYERPINYSLFIDKYQEDNNIFNKLDNKELSYMQCKKCHKKYCIDWRNDNPIPLRNFEYINTFLCNHRYNLKI